MPHSDRAVQQAALWLIGPDMPGLLRIGARFVAERNGNIDRDIAEKVGEKAVVFMSITAPPEDIARMDLEKDTLKEQSGCGVIFHIMADDRVPAGFIEEQHGFEIVTEDAVGIIADVTEVVQKFGALIVSHTGERRKHPGPNHRVQGGQRFIVMIPEHFDHHGFMRALIETIEQYHGQIVTPLGTVSGLLWSW